MQFWEIHPMLVHFPIAFLIGGVVLDLWAATRGRPESRRAATALMAAGFWTGLLAAGAGVLAYFTVPAHTDEAHQIMFWHLGGASAALVLFGWSVWARRPSRAVTLRKVHTVVPCLAVLLVIGAGLLGGHLVFRGGAGVDPSLLAPEIREGHKAHGSDHEMGEGNPKEGQPGTKPTAAKQGEHEHGKAGGQEGQKPPKPESGSEHPPGHKDQGAPGASPQTDASFEIALSNGRRVLVRSGFDALELSRLLAVMDDSKSKEGQPETKSTDAHQGGHEQGKAGGQEPQNPPKPKSEGEHPPGHKAQGKEHEKGENEPKEGQPATSPTAASYTCPMHPDVVSATPGSCPKCGMKLEPKKGDQGDQHQEAAGLHIPPEGLAPGELGKDYTPVITPNGVTLPWKNVDGVKVYHLVAEEVKHEFAPGLSATCWGYNGRVHGPTIEAVEGDRVRIYVTNKLPAPTSVHWHGILLPNGMDGVAGLNQKTIRPGETFVYEFVLRQHGTHMYHAHHDEMTQMALGLMGLFVIHPRVPKGPRIDRDFAILLSEWKIIPGTSRPDPNEMTDFNVTTLNARAFPGTEPLVVALGQRVRIRYANLSAMDHHPMHLHGYQFRITETDGGQIPESAQQVETTALVQVGSTKTIEFMADAPGDWALHCHMTHHVMNQMGHELPNMIGVVPGELDKKVQSLLPDYMTMGQDGMGEMGQMKMAMPRNSIPMLGAEGPFDYITMGGMFTVLKVRPGITTFEDPGWFEHPEGTVARLATPEELGRDDIKAEGGPASKKQEGQKHGGH